MTSSPDFEAWVADTERRWAEAEAAGKVAKVHICNGDCGPLADCADERDTSIDRVRLGLVR